MAVEHALGCLARTVVHVDVGAEPVLGHGDLDIWFLAGQSVGMRVAHVIDGVLLVAKELFALSQHLTCVRLQDDKEPELLVAATSRVLSRDPLD